MDSHFKDYEALFTSEEPPSEYGFGDKDDTAVAESTNGTRGKKSAQWLARGLMDRDIPTPHRRLQEKPDHAGRRRTARILRRRMVDPSRPALRHITACSYCFSDLNLNTKFSTQAK
ncbi:hypothetical protein PG991_011623 [Apiospora marii]|uniref:Uncharacterized protein n=1 Tax=Apiospora marii TaxID=335849 RepID=A0ABR1REM1_9PEZI